uniref:Protein E30 n=1 Tax=Elephant endotheliotropic herpesvirus 1A TaxID=759753 RepID=A0A866VUP1_ELHV1|nr:protein E30 [Elephant endotheliotropic herpesvirus 1A]QOE74796.1 protein E30 [Elephant endotheliotropic herpesvirus 1A]QOE75033.1 protein E30 [Elephant endotheliotropic herpesvirus 1A]
MAPILVLFILVTIVTGLTSRHLQQSEKYSDMELSGSGSGSGDDEESGDELENTTAVESENVATSIGLNATDENFFTPTPEYPTESYISPEGQGGPLVNPEDGFYINSDGLGDPDDDDVPEVKLLVKAFEIIHPFE